MIPPRATTTTPSHARQKSLGVVAILFSSNRKQRSAFTLIELLLAIAMSAAVLVSLYMALSIGLRGRDTVTASLDPVRTANLAVDFARADMESIVPPTGSYLTGTFVATHAAGTAPDSSFDYLQFYCIGGGTSWIVPPAEGAASAGALTAGNLEGQDPLDEGARKIELLVRTDVTPPVLVRRVTRDLFNNAQSAPEEEILVRNIRSFQLRYYDLTNDLWQTDWNSDDLENQLPSAIQITLEIEYLKRGATEPSVYKVIRVVPVPCAKPATDPDAAAAGGAQ